jgi:acyl-CoA synthetase (AMP-forming)/AMP-acid ligase II
MPDPIAIRVLARAAKEPERVAIHILHSASRASFRDEVVTFGDWLRGAGNCAAALAARHLRRGDRVLLCLPTGRAFLDSFLGASMIGAVPVPLPSLEGFARPAAFVNRLTSVVRDAAPSAVLADRRTAAHLRDSGLLDPGLPLIEPRTLPQADPPPTDPALGEETALVQYTSGSTGTPRGVVITARNLAANVDAMGAALRLGGDDRVVSWLPLYHDMGLIGGLLAPVSHGATSWLLSPLEFMLRPAAWVQAISDARATLTVAPNFAYGLVARKVADDDLRGLDLSFLRAAINGAEPVDPATAEAFCTRLAPLGFRRSSYFPVYGLAESTLSVAFPPLDRGVKIDHVRRQDLADGRAVPTDPGPGSIPLVSVGCPIAGHEVSIVGPDHTPLPERRLGEIWVKGPSVSPWYFDQHHAQRERRTALRTGDVGYLAEGELYVVDRLKDLVIVAGRCYSPSDIERAAERVEGVRAGRSVAFGVADSGLGTESLVLLAEVQPRAADELRDLAEAVRNMVSEQIGLSPKEVCLLKPGSLARTSSGKLMRRDARDRYLQGALIHSEALRTLMPLRVVDAARAVVLRFLARRRLSQGQAGR